MTTQPLRIARVTRIASGRPAARAPLSAAEPDALTEWLSSRREETIRQLDAWQAPTLPDEVIDILATIFLMQPGHTLMPFFVWLENRLER